MHRKPHRRNVPHIYILFATTAALIPSTTSATAFEFNAGASVGAIQIGTAPQLALSPFAGLRWKTDNGLSIDLHNMFSVIPGTRVGIYDRSAASLGYAWKTGLVSAGPSLSFYSAPVCGVFICSRVLGIAPGAHAQTDWYFADPFGVSLSGNLDWATGGSRVLSSALVVMVTAGPIWRLPLESK